MQGMGSIVLWNSPDCLFLKTTKILWQHIRPSTSGNWKIKLRLRLCQAQVHLKLRLIKLSQVKFLKLW